MDSGYGLTDYGLVKLVIQICSTADVLRVGAVWWLPTLMKSICAQKNLLRLISSIGSTEIYQSELDRH